jgi:alkanesulfonate monooxygenase SsuD/methylene tetrahydromethanopterin reductase-like flavin-dependent oxidoreductase (luciferase family)
VISTGISAIEAIVLYGSTIPQTEYGSDPVAIRDFAQTAEALGFSHILTYEHVLGVDPNRPGWKGIYSLEDPFHEPFSMFSFMAGVTEQISFLTSIVILPQRQTVLVAKQAATLDVLSGGRLRHNRGRRIEEQVELMRALWTKPIVNFSGQWNTVEDSGMNPMPIQQPIPIWFGGHAEPVIRRAARLGDGWIPNYPTAEEAKPHFEYLEQHLEQAGRTINEFGIEVRVHYREGDPDRIGGLIEDWEAGGATHIGLSTLNSQLDGPVNHLKAMRSFAESHLS